MNHTTSVCPKCSAAMEEGSILDRGHLDAPAVSKWVEGGPPKARWWGLSFEDKERLEVRTYRCTACGYLESYALPAAE